MSSKLPEYVGEVYEQAGGQWGWRIVAPNGRNMAHGEGHTRPQDARRALTRLLSIAPRVRVAATPGPARRRSPRRPR